MANFQWKPLQTGGEFIQGNPNTFNFTDSQVFEDNHVVKIQAPNLTSKSQYVTLSYTTATAGTFNKRPLFKSADGNWIRESANDKFLRDDLKGVIIVFVPRQENGKKFFNTYLCINEAEKLTIPNYGVVPAIETRVVSSITATNFESWRHVTSSMGTKRIPLAISYVEIPVTDQTKRYAYSINAIVSGSKVQLTDDGVNYSDTSNSDLPLPVIGQTHATGDNIVYDIDERLTILEDVVANQTQTITQMSKSIEDLNTKIVDAGVAGSLYFVSR